MKAWIDGKMVDFKDAKVSIFNRGFLYGDGLFESMRSYNGKIFKPEEHLARLYRSLGAIDIKIPYLKEEITGALYRLLRANGLRDAYIRINVTRGEGRLAIGSRGIFKPTVIIFAKPLTPYPKGMYEKGINAKVVCIRTNELSPISRIKSLSFLNNILARQEAMRKGFDEAILMNTRGHVAEAATSSVFLVRGDRLITPSLASGILPGVTRRVVLRLAGEAGLKAGEASISYKELTGADEVFLTNSLFEVMPVVKVDGRKIGRGTVGAKTALLAAGYKELTNSL